MKPSFYLLKANLRHKCSSFMTRHPLDFAYYLGLPKYSAIFRASPEDFLVEEILNQDLSGEGEHFWLFIKKRGENTDWVAKKLANYFSVRKMDVGYGGKKDRHAETKQWFSVYLPGKTHSIDWEAFIAMANIDAELLDSGSHGRKLKIGQHEANKFSITLHDVGKNEDLVERLEIVAEQGVPNYFGEQRFGLEGRNLDKADRWASDPRSIRDKSLRGIIISSARSYLFNHVLSERIKRGDWLKLTDGDPGSSSPTGPLWGRGLSLAGSELLNFERRELEPFEAWTSALENVGLSQERRELCLKPQGFNYSFDQNSLNISFELGAGQYATSVLRELVSLKQKTG